MNDPTKTPPYTCHGGFEGNCESDDDCHSYCMKDPTKTPPYFCHAIKDAPPPLIYDLEPVFEVIADGPAKCEEDSDCKSCVRASRIEDCQFCLNLMLSCQYHVTPMFLLLAFIYFALILLIFILPVLSRYCMNDPTKSPPYTCHGGFQGNCESDDDCQSYCMNDPTKNPPYFCHAIKEDMIVA